ESVYTATYRGFESLLHRQIKKTRPYGRVFAFLSIFIRAAKLGTLYRQHIFKGLQSWIVQLKTALPNE
ncbi:hypothetical protein, partial [Shewanella chilikensis]|uniref:hypothetical protein n=1 Tax=Shewanella chilikensis TaxID=558541 RepID=UPI00399C004F